MRLEKVENTLREEGAFTLKMEFGSFRMDQSLSLSSLALLYICGVEGMWMRNR